MWLTPDAPATSSKSCRRIRIPDSEQFLSLLSGAILSLAEPHNWEKFGDMSTDDTSALFFEIFTEYANSGDACMIGAIFAYASATPPANSLYCDGSIYNRIDYPDLYAALDPAFIVDADTFSVPDLRGRIAMGTDSEISPIYPVGSVGGEYNHVLSVGELALHTHIDSGHQHAEGTSVPSTVLVGVGAPVPTSLSSTGTTGTAFADLGTAGGNTGHNNTQPYSVIRYAIIYA